MLTEDLSPAQFREILEVTLRQVAAFDVSEYATNIESRANLLSGAERRAWLQNELFILLNSAKLKQYHNQKEVLPGQLDEMASQSAIFKVWQQAGMSVDAFLNRVPFLKTVADWYAMEGKVKVVQRMLIAFRVIALKPSFVVLFFNEDAAYRALKAAMNAGIIDEAGKKKLGDRNIIPAIVQFWEAVSDRKFELTHIRAEKEAIAETYLPQCKAIAEQFGTTISKTAIYDHAGKRIGKYFSAVARALGEM